MHHEGSKGGYSEPTFKLDLLVQGGWILGGAGRQLHCIFFIFVGSSDHSHEEVVGYLLAPVGIMPFRWGPFHLTFLL